MIRKTLIIGVGVFRGRPKKTRKSTLPDRLLTTSPVPGSWAVERTHSRGSRPGHRPQPRGRLGAAAAAHSPIPRSSRIRSVPVETRERDVPTAGIIWREGPQWARSPWENKGAAGGSSATRSPRGSKGGSFPVPSASGGGPPCASREEKNTSNKRVKSCPKCEGVSGLDRP